MDWFSEMSPRHWMHGITVMPEATLEKLGVPQDGFIEVVDDRVTALQSMEDGMRGDRGLAPNPDARAKPRAEAALKFNWERLTSVREVSAVYLWYKHMQESALAFGIPLMPFRGITLQHEAFGLMLPGMGNSLWKTSGRLLLRVLQFCVPDDASEESDNIREMMACHTNGYDSLWYILKVVARMMDVHCQPPRPKYDGSLSKHAAAWDVYRMQLNHRGTRYRAENASVQFLRDIICPRFSPAAKVELGMLTRDTPSNVRSGKPWNMPGRYDLRVMAARILLGSLCPPHARRVSPDACASQGGVGCRVRRGMTGTGTRCACSPDTGSTGTPPRRHG
jgi:hypothetical protein